LFCIFRGAPPCIPHHEARKTPILYRTFTKHIKGKIGARPTYFGIAAAGGSSRLSWTATGRFAQPRSSDGGNKELFPANPPIAAKTDRLAKSRLRVFAGEQSNGVAGSNVFQHASDQGAGNRGPFPCAEQFNGQGATDPQEPSSHWSRGGCWRLCTSMSTPQAPRTTAQGEHLRPGRTCQQLAGDAGSAGAGSVACGDFRDGATAARHGELVTSLAGRAGTQRQAAPAGD
jgi:hypothetical protein